MHPQADGQVERFNRTIIEMLRRKIKEDQKDWDLQLAACMIWPIEVLFRSQQGFA